MQVLPIARFTNAFDGHIPRPRRLHNPFCGYEHTHEEWEECDGMVPPKTINTARIAAVANVPSLKVEQFPPFCAESPSHRTARYGRRSGGADHSGAQTARESWDMVTTVSMGTAAHRRMPVQEFLVSPRGADPTGPLQQTHLTRGTIPPFVPPKMPLHMPVLPIQPIQSRQPSPSRRLQVADPAPSHRRRRILTMGQHSMEMAHWMDTSMPRRHC